MDDHSENSPLGSVQETDAEGLSLIHQRTEVSYSGPLPPPGVLAEFERVFPGAAERIFTMAEKQNEHRQSLEKTVIEGIFLATSCYLAHLGMTADALKVVGGSAVGLLTAFGFGTLSRRTERIKKEKIQKSSEAD